MNVHDQIAYYGIDNKSYVTAASDISCQGDLGERAYRERITEMTMQGTSDIPFELVHIMYGYVIQEAIRTNMFGKPLYEYAKEKTTEFYNTHRYIFVVPEEEQRVDVNTGEVKKKKGEKGDLAREAFSDNVNALRDGDLTRKQMLSIMAEAADMSEAGASTYYAKYKKEFNV